jgi:hypothetical protein
MHNDWLLPTSAEMKLLRSHHHKAAATWAYACAAPCPMPQTPGTTIACINSYSQRTLTDAVAESQREIKRMNDYLIFNMPPPPVIVF